MGLMTASSKTEAQIEADPADEIWHGNIPDLTQALRNADIVAATGGGFMCDSDKESCH